MNIRYISFTGFDDNINIDDLTVLLKMHNQIELNVDVDEDNFNFKIQKYKFVQQLLRKSQRAEKPFNLAITVNNKWCSNFCKGDINPDLKNLFDEKDNNTGLPLIKRWQLNVTGKERCKTPDLGQIITSDPNREFILKYSDKLKKTIISLDKIGAKTSLLFDYESIPTNFNDPILHNRPFLIKMDFNDEKEYKLNKASEILKKNQYTDLKYNVTNEQISNILNMIKFTENLLKWERRNYLRKVK